MSKGLSRRSNAALCGASALAIGLALSTQALAQTAPAEGTTNATGQVVVTASRIQRQGFTAPTPTQVQSTAVMQQQAIQDLGVYLEQSPTVRGSADEHSFNTAQNNLYSNPAATYLNLRNLGNGQTGSAARTLVLVDGQRFVFESTGGAVNINAIPTIALDRTEVVTGGSSAAYGSEAVAGVVNLILKKDYEGLEVDGQGGVSTYGDDKTGHLGIIAGTHFGNLHVMAAAEYNYQAGIGPIPYNARNWEAAAYGAVVGAGGVRYLTNNLQVNTQTYGGLITGCQPVGPACPAPTGSVSALSSTSPFHGIQFGANGSPSMFGYGNTYGSTAAGLQSGGSNTYDNNNDTAPVLLPLRHFSSLWRANYDVNPHLNVGVNFIYAADSTDHPTVTARWPGGSGAHPVNFAIKSGNPYIPTQIQNLMNANNVTSITLGKVLRDFGPFEVHGDDQTYQGSLDFKGDFDALAQNWTWDAHAGYGAVRVGTANETNLIDANVQNAIDVVAVNGVAQCASAAARAAGCQPLNPFGEGNSVGVRNYITAPSELWQNTQRTDLNANLHGNPFSTWAGVVSVAMGAEYRRDSISVNSDPLSQAKAFYGDNNQPFSGSINVTEGYVEAVVPLLHDMPFAKEVDFDGSGRYASYNLSGGTWSYKFGGTWQVTDDIRFRGSVSQDERAPNVTELFSSPQPGTQLLQIRLPTAAFAPGTPTQNIPVAATPTSNVQGVAYTEGNLNLKPEIANTYTFGAVWSPTFNEYLRGFRASVDYYNITLNGAILAPSSQNIITFCQSGQTAYCSLLTYVPQGAGYTYSELLQPINIGYIKTSGVDIVLDYTTPLSRYLSSAPGVFSASWTANYVDHLINSAFGVTTDYAGEVGGGLISAGNADTPHWVWDANFHYALSNWGFNAHLHYVGGGVLDVTAKQGGKNYGMIRLPDGTIYNNVPSRIFLNLGVQYDMPKALTWDHSLQLYMNVNNVANESPPAWGRDPSDDIVGRYYTVGFRMKY